MEKKKNKQNRDIVVKFEHLNPNLQEIINSKFSMQDRIDQTSLKNLRRYRGVGDLGLLTTIAASANLPQVPSSQALHVLGGTLFLLGRTISSYGIKIAHRRIVNSMKENGLLQTRFEGHYPKDWINPSIVARTHPSFHVKGNGDIIFHKTTRTEYFRIKFQERFKVAGWRWRACLAPPVAPEKAREWAKQKLAEIARRIPKIKPVIKPVPVPAFSKKRKPIPQKKLRPRFA
ncbi:MAG: hypothetical protein COT90_05110 [Candidatus Diapherotrites archaeon CG10_big_fil_rev_8_21_14_0_10_31_34]|nr:MAG: hypothetical protein COT90_05110 [Candidatus Diapherotrites archaeon CG10_big_fil_rev_8_21_14_0_10_31_34]